MSSEKVGPIAAFLGRLAKALTGPVGGAAGAAVGHPIAGATAAGMAAEKVGKAVAKGFHHAIYEDGLEDVYKAHMRGRGLHVD